MRPALGNAIAIAIAIGVAGCHVYGPVTPRVASSDGATITIDGVVEGVGGVVVNASTDAPSYVTFGQPRLNTADSPPCTGGLLAFQTTLSNGSLSAAFGSVPLSGRSFFDVPVLDATQPGRARCVRVPFVEGTGRAEWTHEPLVTAGLALRGLFVAGHEEDLSGMRGGVVAGLRGGPSLGPLHLRDELFVGAGLSGQDTQSIPSDQVDSFTIAGNGVALGHTIGLGYVGLDLAIGYDALGVWYSPGTATPRPSRTYFLHGPRAALSLLLIGGSDHRPTFRARADAASMGFELGFARWCGADASACVPVVSLALTLDGGL